MFIDVHSTVSIIYPGLYIVDTYCIEEYISFSFAIVSM